MYMQDMALSFVYRIPMLRSTVRTVNVKYNQVKRGNTLAYIVLSFVELCFYLVGQLLCQIQTYDYQKYFATLKDYVYVYVCQYVTPALWTQTTQLFHGAVQLIVEAAAAMVRYVEYILSGLRGFQSPHTTVNFDSPNMNTFIDLITRSLAELKLKENSSMELGGYENEFHQSDHIVQHSSTSCQCDKHHHDHGYYSTNNLEVLPTEPVRHQNFMTGSADDNIIAEAYKDNHQDETLQSGDQDLAHTGANQYEQEWRQIQRGYDTNLETVPLQHEESLATVHDNIMAESYKDNEEEQQAEDQQSLSEDIPSGEDWHKLFPSSNQPLIEMMTADKALALANALKEKRQDKTGRDAYEVDTILVLLSQWSVIDDKARHYAIDRANMLFLAICYGWSYALQKLHPTTTAPIVTPAVTPIIEPPMRQMTSEGLHPSKKLKRSNAIYRPYGQEYRHDSGRFHQHHHTNNRFFQRSSGGDYQNFRQSFPPNMYHRHQNHYNNNNNHF